MSNLSEKEKARLKELIALKKAKKLSDADKAELDALNAKCGYTKPGKDQGFKPGNDFSWWNKEPELTEDCANFKSNYVAGMPIAENEIPFVLAGVAVVKLQSVYGADRWATDPINVWARDLYLRMFQKYRPANGYSASDLGIAIIAGCEIVKLIAKYERVYGVVNRYSKLNVNMPFAEAQALGLARVDVEYLQSHMSDFRYDLNFLIKKAQRLCVPKDLSVVSDSISLFGYEYLDHESARSQIIVFDTDTFGMYDDTAISAGGSIQFNEFDSINPFFDFSADNMCSALANALDALLGSDSIQKIYADLVVWFGEAAMLEFKPVPSDYMIAPVYSESILHKIHNLECMADNTNLALSSWADNLLNLADKGIVLNGSYHVYQVNDRIVTMGSFASTAGTITPFAFDGGEVLLSNYDKPRGIKVAHILDTYRADVIPETIVEGVLYKFAITDVEDAGAGYASVINSAAFFIVRKVITYKMQSGTPVTEFNASVTTYGDATIAKTRAGLLAILDWAPLAYNLDSNGRIVDAYGDLDNIVVIHDNELRRIHRTVILSGMKTAITPISK